MASEGQDLGLSDQYHRLLTERQALPITAHKAMILRAYRSTQVLILSSATGSGKTTQVPQYILCEDLIHGKRVACTQPRRLAATTVAKRVAQELDLEIGQEVGAKVRFEDLTSSKTRLVYMTDGMLLREAMGDKNFTNYSCIIVDEAHERTLPTDLVLGLLKDAISRRRDLKVIIMSATMNAGKFQEYFPDAFRLEIPGRTFPVRLYHLHNATPNYNACALHLVKYIHENMPAGDILVFLTTVIEVERATDLLRQALENLEVIPLHATLSVDEQQRAFRPSSKRRCIVSTNVAETSITIDGVVYVIDTGLVIRSTYNPRAGLKVLGTEPISKAAANQRAGRAGRTRPGICFRLYEKRCYDYSFLPSTPPGVLRDEMAGNLLVLKAMGYENICSFDFVDPPHPEVYLRALEDPPAMGHINHEGSITESGAQAARLPVHPRWYNALIEAHKLGCSFDLITIVAIAEISRPIFIRPYKQREAADLAHSRFFCPLSDHITWLNAIDAYAAAQREGAIDAEEWCSYAFIDIEAIHEALRVRRDLQRIAQGMLGDSLRSVKDSGRQLRRAIARGLYHQLAFRTEKTIYDLYHTVHDNYPAMINPDSALVEAKHNWIVYQDFVYFSRPYLATVTAVDIEWLLDLDHFQDSRFASSSKADAFRQVEARKLFEEARDRVAGRELDVEMERADTTSSDPSTSDEEDLKEWAGWTHPGRPDGIIGQDHRWTPNITDIGKVDKPYEETRDLFPRGIEISEYSDGLEWVPGQLLGPRAFDPNGYAPISHAKKFSPPSETGNDLASATHRGHISKIRRPGQIGAGWGDHDLFREWQLHGRRVKGNMVEKAGWEDSFGGRILLRPDGDDIETIEFLPYKGYFKELESERKPRTMYSTAAGRRLGY